jgi:RHS repeat-associated protein
VTPTYNANGNLTFDGTFTFAYDGENRLSTASGAGNSAGYSYDAQGRRKTKTVNGATTVYVTDADNREVMQYDGASGAISRWFAYGLGSNDVLSQMNVAAATRATFIPDIQGSIIASLDSTTGALSKIGYSPYGKSTGAGPFGYTAQRIDPETNGLYYYRARHYSPAWGRFMQPDPIGYAGGNNLYAYVGNDPLNRIDPTGADPVLGATVGLFAGAYYGALGAYGAPGSSWKSILAGAGAGGLAGAVVGYLDISFGVYTVGAVGAIAGGIGDIVGQGVTNLANDRSFTANLNYGSTAGAIVGGAVGAVGGATLSGLAAKAGISDLAGTVMGTSIANGPGALLQGTGAAISDSFTGKSEGENLNQGSGSTTPNSSATPDSSGTPNSAGLGAAQGSMK